MSSDSTSRFLGKKPPLPYSLAQSSSSTSEKPPTRKYSTINKINLNELLNPSPSQSHLNRGFEIPCASPTFRASPKTNSILCGTISSSSVANSLERKNSSSLRLKDSFKKDRYINPLKSEDANLEVSSAHKTSKVYSTTPPLSAPVQEAQSTRSSKKKASPSPPSVSSFIQRKRHSFESLLGICKLFVLRLFSLDFFHLSSKLEKTCFYRL